MTICIARSTALVFMLSGFFLTPAAHAAAPKVAIPDQIPGVTRVDAEGVINLSEKTPNLILVDSRIAGDRKQGYIEKSISLPDEKTNCASLAKIIPKKSSPTLFYCNGLKCGRSVVAVRIALKCGYEKLYWFQGGYEEWTQKDYPVVHE